MFLNCSSLLLYATVLSVSVIRFFVVRTYSLAQMSTVLELRKRGRDPNDVDSSTEAMRRRVTDKAPVVRLLPMILPHFNQKVDMYASFNSAAQVSTGASTADGLFLCPSVNEFCRCILAAANSTCTFFVNIVSFNSPYTLLNATVRLRLDMMLPLINADLAAAPDISAYPLGRCVSGCHVVKASTSNATAATISGDMGGAWCDNTAGNYGFARVTTAQSASYPKDKELSERADGGLFLNVPPIAWNFDYTSSLVALPGGSLISRDTSPASTVGLFFFSHVLECTDSNVSNTRFADIPWGARPTFEVSFAAGVATSYDLMPVRVYHCFATWGTTGWNVAVVQGSLLACNACVSSPSTFNITVPAIGRGIRDGIWVGTFIKLDPTTPNQHGVPIVNTVLHYRQFLLNFSHVVRLDNLSAGVSFDVKSSLYYEMTKNSLNAPYLSNENVPHESALVEKQVLDLSEFMNSNGTFSSVLALSQT